MNDGSLFVVRSRREIHESLDEFDGTDDVYSETFGHYNRVEIEERSWWWDVGSVEGKDVYGPDFLDDLAETLHITHGNGECQDFGLGKLGFDLGFGFFQTLLSASDDSDNGRSSFGESFRCLESDSIRYARSVELYGAFCLLIYSHPPVTRTVLPAKLSSGRDGEMLG